MIRTLLLDLDDTLLENDVETFVPAYLQRLGAFLNDLAPAERLIPLLLHATRVMLENNDPEITLERVFAGNFYPPNTNVLTGNGGRSILCDNSSWFFGDLTGLYNFSCRVAELRGRPHRTWMDNSPREEKPVPYVPRWRRH